MRRYSSLIAVLVAAFAAGFVKTATGGTEQGSFTIPLAETLGGTHQATWATGDFPYASGSNTLSKLGIGTSGYLLTVSGGVPAWVTAAGVSDTSIYGDGSDGSITWDGTTTLLGLVPATSTYTLTRDIFLTSSTVNNGVTIVVAGWRILGTGTLTNNGTIQANGGNGGNRSGATGGAAGAAAVGNFTGAGFAGGAGKNTPATTGNGGTNATNSLGGAGGHAGANSVSSGGGAGGTVTAFTAFFGGFRAYPAITTGRTELYGSGGPFKGGGGGGGGAPSATAGSGGGGGGGGAVVICFKSIDNTNGTISANGGNGGDGLGGSSGKGGGGGGGLVFYTYNTYTGTVPVAAAGAAGTNGVATGVTAAAAGTVLGVSNQ